MAIEKLGEKKESIRPSQEESRIAKDIDSQIIAMLKEAIVDCHFIEAQTLSWSAIEQLLLPRLIGWIAKEFGVSLSKETDRLNSQNLNLIYLCLSHDEELYKKLEICRRQRNKITHKLTSLGDINSVNKIAKSYTEANILLQQEIMKRFDGIVPIPSINLYRKGWNDALNSAIKVIRKK